MTAIWDEAFLKQRERDAREDALAVQSDEDWKFAVLQLERVRSDLERGFAKCQLPACRRAKRCVGNPPVCTARVELQPGAEQDLVEEFYADIQQQRRNASAGEGRPPEVERVLHYVKDDEQIEGIDEPTPRDEPGRNIEIVRHAVRRDVAPAAPKPQPPLRQPAPPASPRVAAPALPAPPPPPVEPVSSPEVEERVNRIWNDYVEAKRRGEPPPRPGPRIRAL